MLEYRLSRIPMSDVHDYVKMDVYVDGAGPIAYLPVRSDGRLVVSASDVQTQMRVFEDLYQGERS